MPDGAQRGGRRRASGSDTHTSIIGLIRQLIPVGERFEFEDYTDDDGLGNGPIKLKRAMWREDDSLHLDWSGTDAQVP